MNDEFGRRAAFALLACMALHGRGDEADFLRGLALIEACRDRRAELREEGRELGAAGHRRQAEPARCAPPARDLAARLAASPDKTARWIGKDAARAFAKADLKPIGPRERTD